MGLASCLMFWPKPIRVSLLSYSSLSQPLTHKSTEHTHSSHLSCPAAAATSLLQFCTSLSSPPFRFPAAPPSLPAALPLFLAAAAAASDVASLVEKALAKLSPKMVAEAKDPKRKAKS